MSGSDEVREQVKELLLDHRGADDPITSREINEQVDLDNVGSFPSTRAVVRDIVMEDHIPVAGGSNGYYVIQEEDELDAYVERLESRVMNITERKFAVQRAVLEWDEDIVEDDGDLL
ncbi:hypothetical protein DU500_09020 [Haloplanus rubicundus]|uniref:Uncharacterized protein n=1 Tax=Haloplanus rubicundus TaxID=1547898 RepID=A0A345E2Y2_9EURY|nr:hypothetical protein [Haloplanus rubicundus]AXG06554.1 hypothetical protein DU500_09020 [Haloplanus rubicundus]